MKQIKRIIISASIAIIAILGLNTISNAYYVGQKVNITFNNYWNNQNIYCVEHGQDLTSSNSYKIISNVKIEGRKSTDHKGKTIDSWYNAKLAYILSASNGSHKTSGPVANSVWNFMYTWLGKVGHKHAGLYKGFSNGVQGSKSWLDTKSSEYANNLKEEKEITDNTNKDKIKVTAYEKDGKSYMRVGPFNWSFPGTMEKVTVKDQNGNNIKNILFSNFKGKEEKWFKANKIKSGSNFYISIPVDADVTKITKIIGEASTEVKGVNIWFLEATSGYKQNLIIRDPFTADVDIETPFDYDIPIQGHLKVIKVNKNNEEVKLKDVGFYIQHKNTGKYISRDTKGNISYVEKDKATEFVTDKNGEILIKNLVVGTYVAYETKNPNYGYEIITEGQEKQVKVDKTAELKIPNKQVLVKLSGYVWVDIEDGKGPDRNDLFKDPDTPNKHTEGQFLPDTKDMLFNGVTVRLMDKTTGQVVKNKDGKEMITVTSKLDRYKDSVNDGNGEYLFEDVLIENLGNYYIEFEYDGLTYTNVIPYISEDNGSKAAESEAVRDAFNKNFSSVEGSGRDTGFTRDANGNAKHQLSYNISENDHKATLINNGQYTITANTDVAKYIIKDHFVYGQEEIRYINLGLHKREQPDIALVKDLQNVRLTINGYEHTYFYAQRFVNEGEYGDGFNVGVKFGSKYGSMSYTRAIYKADYEFENPNDRDSELKVYVTYQLTMRNQSSNLSAKVNSIVDYYDSRYNSDNTEGIAVKAGTGLDEAGNVINELQTSEKSSYNEAYDKIIINSNTEIGPQKEASIYVQFALSREAVINILNDGENLNNVAEIDSYSIYKDGKVYAGIDIDSNPGNCVPGDTKTYEDDTDSSPALKLEVADAREMAGKVFLDGTSAELLTGEIRQGSGAYEEGEAGIEGVEITLTENRGSGKVYTAKTDANGDFLITGYIPGDYTLTYTWGNQTYTVQDYKGTVYDKDRYEANLANGKWYKDVDNRLTDAVDNYNVDQEPPKGSRLQIDEEIATGNITRTKMDSTTPTMKIGVEYETTYTASMGDRYVYKISNIDFGIVERARQKLDIMKEVTGVKITLANGQLLIDAKIVDGKLEGETKGLTYMGPNENSNGFVKAEIDNELIQGAVIQIEYAITVINNGEKDYDSEEYYKYGIQTGDIIKVAPSGVYDYLDSEMAIDSDKNQGDNEWKVVSREEYDNKYQSPTLVEKYFNEGKTTETAGDGTITETYKWNTSISTYQNSFEDWASEVTLQRTVRDVKLTDKTILNNETIQRELAPTESNSVKLYTTKMLSNAEEIDLNNSVEITEVERIQKTGRLPEASESHLYGEGETVTVTPPTGEARNYIIPVITIITAIAILGVGIVIIKKKVI